MTRKRKTRQLGWKVIEEKKCLGKVIKEEEEERDSRKTTEWH